MFRRILIALLLIAGCKADPATPSPAPAPAPAPAPKSAQQALKQIVADVEELEEPPAGTVYRPPAEADFAAIHPVLDPSLGTACAIRIQVWPSANYDKTRVKIAYARDGHLSARIDDFYSRDGTKRESRPPRTYSWRDGRLATTAFSELSYETSGLLASESWSADSTQTFAWKVTPVTAYTRLEFPSEIDERSSLPWQIPFTGTVTITSKGAGSKDRIETFHYDANGLLVRPNEQRDASGRIVRDNLTIWRWRDDAVVEQQIGTDVYEYTYDDQHRLLRERLTRNGGADEEQRWEYRCPGPWIDDPIWPR